MQNSNESKATKEYHREYRKKYNKENPEKVKTWKETTYSNFLKKNGYSISKRKTYSPEEEQEMREAGTTQGRKGCKAVRINMAFSPSVHAYIRTMARVRGESVSEFTEHVFRLSMEENKELYELAQSFKEGI